MVIYLIYLENTAWQLMNIARYSHLIVCLHEDMLEKPIIDFD